MPNDQRLTVLQIVLLEPVGDRMRIKADLIVGSCRIPSESYNYSPLNEEGARLAAVQKKAQYDTRG